MNRLRDILADIDGRDVAALAGLLCVTVGVVQIYRPAAWIFVGAFFLWLTMRSAA